MNNPYANSKAKIKAGNWLYYANPIWHNTGAHATLYYQCHMVIAPQSLVRAEDETLARCTSVYSAGEHRLLGTTTWRTQLAPSCQMSE